MSSTIAYGLFRMNIPDETRARQLDPLVCGFLATLDRTVGHSRGTRTRLPAANDDNSRPISAQLTAYLLLSPARRGRSQEAGVVSEGDCGELDETNCKKSRPRSLSFSGFKVARPK